MTTMKINEKKFTIEITKTFAQKASRVLLNTLSCWKCAIISPSSR